jgi:hypothetical protein
MPDHASDLLKNNESAVVIFTRGIKFTFDNAGKGYSGNWRIRRDDLDRVIIYYRPEERLFGAEIYIGNFDKLDRAIEPETSERRISRRNVHFTNLEHAGETDVNFRQFTGTRRNAFCFSNGTNH